MLHDFTCESEFFTNSGVLHELTPHKIRDILLVASPYNIFNLEEGGVLTSQIDNEYKGLRLENPPRVSGVASAEEAIILLEQKNFDMVLIVPHLDRMEISSLGLKIKAHRPDIPIILLSQNTRDISTLLGDDHLAGIDGIYRWFGNPDLLLAIIKITEDHKNVEHDTHCANVRVLVFVEDSPDNYSYLLPLFYKEVVNQTQALIESGLTAKQRALILRQRPKLLLAKTYEEGLALCRKYKAYLLCIASDTRIPRDGRITADAGFHLLCQMSDEIPGVPALMMSSEDVNREKAEQSGLSFLDKDSPNLAKRIHSFFLEQLGFGDFIFRMPNGVEVDRAKNFLSLEEKLKTAPNESLIYHAKQHHFSRWVMARSEISLAIKFRAINFSDFADVASLRSFLIKNIHTLRKNRQQGVVSRYDKHNFDASIREFVKIGNGVLGGKARGLAFVSDLFRQNDGLHLRHPKIAIKVPKTLVLCTDIFDEFVTQNNLRSILRKELSDEEISKLFLSASLQEPVLRNLYSYLKQVTYPLSIRSSSQMEDAHHQPYAGLYKTYKIPNNDLVLSTRLEQLVKAIKLVYASTYFQEPRSYSRSTSNQHSKESMAVIIQQVAGQQHGDYYYPTISGIAQSYNYYPFGKMKADEGIIHMVLGLGKAVVDGETCIRFSPRYPGHIPQFSTVEDILKNAQKEFYALKTKNYPAMLNFESHSNLEKRFIDDALNEDPVKFLTSTFVPGEHRIRDTWDMKGPKVLTFARVLKYNLFGIPEVLSDLLEVGKKGFGCPIEIEFSININTKAERPVELYFLQIRPMFSHEGQHNIDISEKDLNRAFCYSTQALGNGVNSNIIDIVYIKPDQFKANATLQIAEEIERINKKLVKEKRQYLLAGPGRWGGADRWLGIPVKWHQISNVGAIVEIRNMDLNADPSQGSHFFQNITSLGIHYVMLDELKQESVNDCKEFFDWNWVASLPAVSETEFIRHITLEKPITLKMDGRSSKCIMLKP